MPADATSPKKLRNNRATLTHKTGYALRHPGRVVPYLRRAGRDAWLRQAQRHGVHARFMQDWETRPHGQSKIRVSRSPLPVV